MIENNEYEVFIMDIGGKNKIIKILNLGGTNMIYQRESMFEDMPQEEVLSDMKRLKEELEKIVFEEISLKEYTERIIGNGKREISIKFIIR